MIKQFSCTQCQNIFDRNDAYIKYRKQKNVFCSQRCRFVFYKRPNGQIKTCSQCNKEKLVSNSDIRKNKTGHFFCNIQCRTIFFNNQRPKKIIIKPPAKLRKREVILSLSIAEYSTKYTGANKYNQIRQISRDMMKEHKKCSKCGYDKHVEICHIQPISSFPPETKISVVNDKSNLIALCPNCHWELDHGLYNL